MSTANLQKKKSEGELSLVRSPNCANLYFDKMTGISINASVSKIVFVTDDMFQGTSSEDLILTLPTSVLLEFRKILNEAFSDESLIAELNSKLLELQNKLK